MAERKPWDHVGRQQHGFGAHRDWPIETAHPWATPSETGFGASLTGSNARKPSKLDSRAPSGISDSKAKHSTERTAEDEHVCGRAAIDLARSVVRCEPVQKALGDTVPVSRGGVDLNRRLGLH